jgi:CTP synthase
MQQEGLDKVVCEKLALNGKEVPDLKKWNTFLKNLNNPSNAINIALVGKYVELKDSYISIAEALIHAGANNQTKINLHWIHSSKIEKNNSSSELENMDGVLVAPGFGERGIEGKIASVKYARENNIPFLGICLGMQCAVVEFARNVMSLDDANTTEIKADCSSPVINMMKEQKQLKNMGGTMRLGSYECDIKKGTLLEKVYNHQEISERHRHRYEFNNDYKEEFEKNGMVFSGKNNENQLMETIELPTHPWFIGVQYHPEYKSTVENPHPLFIGFVKAGLAYSKDKNTTIS